MYISSLLILEIIICSVGITSPPLCHNSNDLKYYSKILLNNQLYQLHNCLPDKYLYFCWDNHTTSPLELFNLPPIHKQAIGFWASKIPTTASKMFTSVINIYWYWIHQMRYEYVFMFCVRFLTTFWVLSLYWFDFFSHAYQTNID